MTAIVQRPARTVDDVVATMTQIERTLPSSDGVWWFNHLYLRVTLGVRAAIGGAAIFHDPHFLDRLDVVFGNLYFYALAAGDSSPNQAPPAWRPRCSSGMRRAWRRCSSRSRG